MYAGKADRRILIRDIEDSNIKLPNDIKYYKKNDYPHLTIILTLFSMYKVYPKDIKNNVDIIASLDEDELMKMSVPDLMDRGVKFLLN